MNKTWYTQLYKAGKMQACIVKYTTKRLCCCMVDSGVYSITQASIRCLLGNFFFWFLVTYGHVSILWLVKIISNNIQIHWSTLKVPVYGGQLPLLYEGVMEEDSLVMVADILDQSFHFRYSLSSIWFVKHCWQATSNFHTNTSFWFPCGLWEEENSFEGASTECVDIHGLLAWDCS